VFRKSESSNCDECGPLYLFLELLDEDIRSLDLRMRNKEFLGSRGTRFRGQTDSVSGIRICNCISDLLSITLKQ
jgi:hypothetical protein